MGAVNGMKYVSSSGGGNFALNSTLLSANI